MAGDDSFDPRTWSPAGSPGAPDTPGASSARVTLPDIFADLAGATAPGPPAPPIERTPPAQATGMPRWLPYLASAALLAAGGGYARWDHHGAGRDVTPAPVADASGPAALPADESVSKRTLALSGVGDVRGALQAIGLPPPEVAAATAAVARALPAGSGEIRATVSFRTTGDVPHLVRLDVSQPSGAGAVVSTDARGAITGRAVAAELSRQIKVVRGELDADSFYTSAVTAGLIDSLIPEFVNAFSFDFNLAAEVHPGDTFEVAYEQAVNAAGEPVGQARLLFASLTTADKSRSLYRFKPSSGEVGWFDGNGGSTVRSFMRTPVDGARITSKFGMRFHPVLHYTRLHGGVDFGVPIGTPIYAAAGGFITSATPTSCGGNMVVMRHDNGWETRYFHLSKYADGLHAGQRVEQGFTLGLSGTTGTCTTGPHLHYEVHINGERVDPLSIQTDAGRKPLDAADRPAFLKLRDQIDVARARSRF